ncbi:MAG: nucleoside triphosphate pyrophosphatase [Pseudomonadales bacterium]
MIYLASNSPRRQELLQQIDISFEKLSVDIDETKRAHETPEQYVIRMATEKAAAGRAVALKPLAVLSADTSVVIDDSCLGKPNSEAHAAKMLRQLSGREHQVMSAVAIDYKGVVTCRLSKTSVAFKPLSDQEISSYWRTGEPCDKAGAYAIQGRAAVFVENISGSYSGVVGLPLSETWLLLQQLGIVPTET